MKSEFINSLVIQVTASILGVFLGALAALAKDRDRTHKRNQRRAQTLLRILKLELTENYQTLMAVKPAFENTLFGKSFYVTTIGWETALADGDLHEILGYDLADRLAAHYGGLVRIRYYVDLLTRLWMSPQNIEGYEEIRKGFRLAILESLEKTIAGHDEVIRAMNIG